VKISVRTARRRRIEKHPETSDAARGLPGVQWVSRSAAVKETLLGLFSALPAYGALLFAILSLGVNVPIWDQWRFVRSLRILWEQGFSLRELLAYDWQHPILLPRLLMILLAASTNYDTKTEMLLGYLFLCGTGAVSWLLYHQNMSPGLGRYLFWLPVPWLLASLRQYETLLFGWPSAIFFPSLLFAVGAFFAVEKCRGLDQWWWLALFSALFSLLCFGAGVAVWLAAGVQLWIRAKRKELEPFEGRRALRAWWTLALLVLFFYGLGVVYWDGFCRAIGCPVGQTGESRLLSVILFVLSHPLRRPWEGLGYWLAVQGNPLAFDRAIAIAAGLLLTTAGAWLFFRESFGGILGSEPGKVASAWLALICFGWTSSLLVLFGRSYLGLDQALTSRYASITTLGLLGVYFGFVQAGWHPGKKAFRTLVLGSLLGAILVLEPEAYLKGWAEAYRFQEQARQCRRVLRSYRSENDAALLLLYCRPDLVREGAAFLERHKLSVFCPRRKPPRWGKRLVILSGRRSLDGKTKGIPSG
jgi:hypothetical protein